MRFKPITILLALAGLMSFLHAEEVKPLDMPPVILSQAVDILDTTNHGLGPEGMSKELLRKRVQMAYDAGIRKLYFRATGGVVYYPGSKIRRFYNGIRPSGGEGGLHTLHSYDVLAEYLKVCHEMGMQLYYWEPVFDTCGGYHWPLGTAWAEKYGEWPFRDTSIPDEQHWEHRLARRPPQELARPIRKIVLKISTAPKLTSEQVQIYTGMHNHDFEPYEKPYTLSIIPAPAGERSYKSLMVFDDLEITNPCVKFVSKVFDQPVGIWPDGVGNITAEYDNGEVVDLFTVGEILLFGDLDPCLVRNGLGGFSHNWGTRQWGGPISFIVRFGDYTRYAIGVPEYAFKGNRDRLKALVTELYTLYPAIDGIAFSIRTHTLPAGGNAQQVGSKLIYGFSEPVVREFIKRYGVNPREEPFDENAYQKLHGEYFTQMLAEVAPVVHEHGGKLECMAPIPCADKIAHGSMYPWWTYANIDNFFDIRTWAQRGLVDNVIMIGANHRLTDWSDKWHQSVEDFARHLEGTKTRLSLHVLAGRDDPKFIRALMPQVLREEKLSEIEIYEEWEMAQWNLYPGYVEGVKESGRKIVDKFDE